MSSSKVNPEKQPGLAIHLKICMETSFWRLRVGMTMIESVIWRAEENAAQERRRPSDGRDWKLPKCKFPSLHTRLQLYCSTRGSVHIDPFRPFYSFTEVWLHLSQQEINPESNCSTLRGLYLSGELCYCRGQSAELVECFINTRNNLAVFAGFSLTKMFFFQTWPAKSKWLATFSWPCLPTSLALYSSSLWCSTTSFR